MSPFRWTSKCVWIQFFKLFHYNWFTAFNQSCLFKCLFNFFGKLLLNLRDQLFSRQDSIHDFLSATQVGDSIFKSLAPQTLDLARTLLPNTDLPKKLLISLNSIVSTTFNTSSWNFWNFLPISSDHHFVAIVSFRENGYNVSGQPFADYRKDLC